MGNFSEQQRRQEEIKENMRVRREKLSSFFYNLAQLSFAALVLGGLSPLVSHSHNETEPLMLLMGIVTTVTFAIFANNILK